MVGKCLKILFFAASIYHILSVWVCVCVCVQADKIQIVYRAGGGEWLPLILVLVSVLPGWLWWKPIKPHLQNIIGMKWDTVRICILSLLPTVESRDTQYLIALNLQIYFLIKVAWRLFKFSWYKCLNAWRIKFEQFLS